LITNHQGFHLKPQLINQAGIYNMNTFLSLTGSMVLSSLITIPQAFAGDGLAAVYGGYNNKPSNNKMYLFNGQQYVRWHSANAKMDSGYPRSISAWKSLPHNIDAGVYAGFSNGAFNNKLYLFKDSYYWRWNNQSNAMDKGYPKLISKGWPGLPNNLDAAVYGGYSASSRNNKLYFFKDAYYYRWDIEKDQLDAGYPKLIRYGWPGLPDNLEMAVYAGYSSKGRNNKLYFFKDNRYWRWNISTDKADANYPLNISQYWPGLR